MRISVLQHRVRSTVADDIAALKALVVQACAGGADLVVCPWIPSIATSHDPSVRVRVLEALDECAAGTALMLALRAPDRHPEPRVSDSPLGRTALMLGDECLLEGPEGEVAAAQAWVWRPLSESDLQAEAVIERALAASAAYVGLVLIAEPVGADPGDIGHGASAICYLGAVLAEATSDEEQILTVDLEVPAPSPEPREPMPALPPILSQRLAVHSGRRVTTEYPSDA